MENYSYIKNQIHALDSIIEQCPFTGGPAVYKARFLYSLIDPNIVWGVDNICILSGISPRLADPYKTEKIISVYPNPANDKINITCFIGNDVKAKLQLYNSLGKLILDKELDNMQNEQLISLEKISSGIYLCTINYNNERVYNVTFFTSKISV